MSQPQNCECYTPANNCCPRYWDAVGALRNFDVCRLKNQLCVILTLLQRLSAQVNVDKTNNAPEPSFITRTYAAQLVAALDDAKLVKLDHAGVPTTSVNAHMFGISIPLGCQFIQDFLKDIHMLDLSSTPDFLVLDFFVNGGVLYADADNYETYLADLNAHFNDIKSFFDSYFANVECD